MNRNERVEGSNAVARVQYRASLDGCSDRAVDQSIVTTDSSESAARSGPVRDSTSAGSQV